MRAATPSNGSSGNALVATGLRLGGGPPRSDGRVAQAGNGNSTTSGTGISGCDTNIVPGLGDRGPLAVRRREEAVLGRCASAGVETARDADRAVRDDPPLDLAGGLLGADEDDAERAAALGDVEQDLLDRRVALRRRVLVQLVEHEEQQRTCRARRFLLVERAADRDADDEALGPVVEVVEVDDRDLSRPTCGSDGRGRSLHVGADQMPQRTLRRRAAGG